MDKNLKQKKYILYITIIMILVCILFFSINNKFDSSNLLNKVDLVETDNNIVDAQVSMEISLSSGVDLIANSTKATDMKNNTINLQKTIDDMSESGGGTIYLPAGTYYFSQGGSSNRGEKYAIRCRNNVHLKGAGTNENKTGSYTILKPYYDDSTARGGMDMFYFNNYADTGYLESGSVDTTTTRDLEYVDINGITQTLENQTVYLINADFTDFIVDGDSSRGGIASCGGSYQTDGKGFMINLFKDCDWYNVVVKNTDATGFGVDCPINSTIKNCKAINCGKAATTDDGGASGFGIGTGFSNEESLIISNCVAINNKKFGFFFEHQARFTSAYYATKSKGFVVENSTAGGNLYDFGGLKAYDVTYQNVKSISGKGTYYDANFKNVTTSSGTCGYSTTTFSSTNTIKLNTNTQPVYFTMYSKNNHVIKSTVNSYVTDVKQNTTEVSWAINNGIMPLYSSTSFKPSSAMTRFDIINTLWKYKNAPGTITTLKTTKERKENQTTVTNIGYTDLGGTAYRDDLDSVIWAYNNGIISKDTNFNPTRNCTRAEFITMLYRLAKSPTSTATVPFTDVSTSSWYYNAVRWGYEKGIIKGSTDNTFLPNDNVTKTQVAIFLYRYNSLTSNKYSITYNTIGGTTPSNITTYTSSSLPYTLKNPTKSGYTFLGWTGSNGITPNKSLKITSGTTGDLVYTANWQANLTKIEIKTTPTNKKYFTGDKLNATGLALNAYYSGGEIKTITSGYTLSPTTLSTDGVQKITVTYGGKTTSFNVMVVELKVSSITVLSKPTQISYYKGEKLNTSGLSLSVKYNNNTTKTVTSGYTVSPTTLSNTGTQKIIVTYEGSTTTFDVNVQDIKISSISVLSKPNKISYFKGDKLDTSGLSLLIKYNDGTTKTVTSGYTISPTTLSNTGTQKIIVTYEGSTTTFDVNVQDIKVSSISVLSKPNKTSYFKGDKLDTSGLSLLIKYNDGTTKTITSGYAISPITLQTVGTQKITITYEEKTTTFDVSVQDIKVSSISVLSKPNKTLYFKGDKLDTSGLTLSVKYNNNTTKTIISGYKVSPTTLSNTGTQKITVTYEGSTTTFDVIVKNNTLKSISIKTLPRQTNYYEGELLKLDGLTLELLYEDGSKDIVTNGYETETVKLDCIGEQKITIKYADKTTNFTVNVTKEEIKSISINNLPKQVTYYVGDTFTSEGLTINLNKNSGYVEEITNGYTLSIQENSKLNKAGTYKVIVTYNNLKTNFNIEVKNIKKDSLILVSRPNKISYIVGEHLELEGLKLEYIDSKGNKKEIESGYSASIKEGTILNNKGNINVVVTYNKQKVNFEIEVKSISTLTVDLTEIKTEYVVGEVFDEQGIVLIVNYSNNTKEKITNGYNIYTDNGTTFTTPGQKEIIIEYNGTTTTLIVNVTEPVETQNDVPTAKENNNIMIIIISVLSLVIVAAAIIVIVIYKRKKKTNYY